MPKPVLLIITGAPASGKTTLGRRLAVDLCLPFIGKDDIKETLFDSLGWKDRDWSRQLGLATYQLLYYFVDTELRAGKSLVVESNFRPEYDAAKFLKLHQQYDFEPVQIFCRAADQVLHERVRRRALSGERHPGHVDHVLYEEMQSVPVQAGYDPLPIGGAVITVDTTELAGVDYGAILQEIRSFTGL
jgi:predicted kinase